MDSLEELIHSDLQQYLLSMNEIDERLPECPKYKVYTLNVSFEERRYSPGVIPVLFLNMRVK